MTEEEIFNSSAFKRFYNTLLTMRIRGADRDNTILLSLQYDSFEDFYDSYKSFFICHYKDNNNLVKAILRIFFCCQLSCLNDGSKERNERIFSFIANFTEEHYEDMLRLLEKHHQKVLKEIYNFNQNKSLKLSIF